MAVSKHLLFALLLAAGSANAETSPSAKGATASIEIQNRSGYEMTFVAWNDGRTCSEKAALPADLNINAAQTQKIRLPAGKPVAFGVGIFDMKDKAPVVCDYIMSFVLVPDSEYRLEYDIHNRRCFAQMFRSSQGTFQMVIPGDAEDFHEKIPEFGWDQFEPGCSGE